MKVIDIDIKKELSVFIQKEQPINLILKKVSSSGMSRNFTILGIKEGQIVDVTSMVARLLDYNYKFDGLSDYIIVKGCGMDMAFKLAYDIKTALYDLSDGTYRAF
jgi:hypothetical protein